MTAHFAPIGLSVHQTFQTAKESEVKVKNGGKSLDGSNGGWMLVLKTSCTVCGCRRQLHCINIWRSNSAVGEEENDKGPKSSKTTVLALRSTVRGATPKSTAKKDHKTLPTANKSQSKRLDLHIGKKSCLYQIIV